MKIFSAKTLREARGVISSALIDHDTLFDWIYENIPFVLDDPRDLAEGVEALARADVHQTRGQRTQEYRLLKYMFNEMTGGVALARRESEGAGLLKLIRKRIKELGSRQADIAIAESPDGLEVKPIRHLDSDWGKANAFLRELGGRWVREKGLWSLPYFRPPQLIWRYRRTWHSRHRRSSIAERVARNCHISTKEAVADVIPLMKVIFQGNASMANEISEWLELGEKEAEWLRS